MRQHPDNGKYIFLIFLVWPFSALLVALRNYRTTWFKNIIWIFVAFYGLSMVVEGNSNDSTRQRDELIELHTQKISITNFFDNLLSEDGEVDVLNPLLLIVISRFTNNYHVLFAVYGLVFGFFYSRNITMLLSKTAGRFTLISTLLIFTFAFLVGPWQINGFRFWTATQIFVYGALLYFLENRKVGLIFILSTFLVHFSFLLPIGIFGLYLVLGNQLPLFFYLYIATFFIKELNIAFINDLVQNYLPDVFRKRVELYTNEDTIQRRKAEDYVDLSWHVTASAFFIRWSVITFTILFFIEARKKIADIKPLMGLLSFALLMASVGNIAGLIPSGIRYLTIASLLMIGFMFLYVHTFKMDRLLNLWKIFGYIALSFFIIMGLRQASEYASILTIFGNIFVSASVKSVTIIDFVKSLIGL